MDVETLNVNALPVDTVILVNADKDILPVEYKLMVAIDSYFNKRKCVILSVIDPLDGEFLIGEFFVNSIALGKDVTCIPVPVKNDESTVRIGTRQLLKKVTKIEYYLPIPSGDRKVS